MTAAWAVTQNRCRNQAGFTLLELLVVLAVLGLLIIGLNQGVRVGLDLWRRQSQHINSTAELDATARVLRNVLTNLPISPAATTDPAAPPAPIAFAGSVNRLRLVGDLPTGLGATQRADMTLALKDDRLTLVWSPYRHERAPKPQKSTETELARGVAHFELAYWDSSPDGTAGWLAQWDGPVIPALIRIRLSFADGSVRHWPDLIVAPRLWTPWL